MNMQDLSDSLKSTDPWKHHIHKIMLIKATRNGHDEIVRLLLNFIDFDKSSLSLSLLEAIRLGYPAIVNNLLEKKADLEVRNKDNNTPLMYVAKFEESLPEQIDVSPDEDAAQDLLEDEKPKNYPKKKSKISNNHEKIAKNLLEHEAQVNSINDKGETALMLAARAGKKDFVELLLDYNADPNLRNMNNQSALEIAQEKGHKDLVILLSSFPLPKVQEESIIENREEEIATQQEPQNEVPIEPIAENVLEEESSTELINLVSSSSEEWKDLASTVSLSEDENSEIDSELFSYSPEILAEVPNQLPFSEEVDNEMKEEPKAKPKETRQADESINDVTDYFNQDSGSPSIFISNDIVQVTSKSITVAEVKKTTTDDEVDEVIKELEKVDKDKNEGLRSKETKVVPPPKTIVKRTLLDSIAAHATLWSMVGFSLGGIAGGVIAVLGAGPTLGLSFLAAFPLFLFTAGVGFIIGGLIGGIVGAVMHVPQPQPSDKVIEKNAAERKIDESVSSKNKSRNSYANQLSAVLEKKSTEKIPSSPASTTLTKNYNNPIHTKIKKEPTQVKKIVGSRRKS